MHRVSVWFRLSNHHLAIVAEESFDDCEWGPAALVGKVLHQLADRVLGGFVAQIVDVLFAVLEPAEITSHCLRIQIDPCPLCRAEMSVDRIETKIRG